MTRNPTLRPRQMRDSREFCASAQRILYSAAAGFSAVFLTFALFWR